MTKGHAEQIASLINERNQLVKQYGSDEILQHEGSYEYEVRDGRVVACAERKKIQWYQWEIRHLSVARDWEGKGMAFAVYQRAAAAALAGGAHVLQCTIRAGNSDSEKFFQRQDFSKVGSFFYDATGNTVGIWQKVICPPE